MNRFKIKLDKTKFDRNKAALTTILGEGRLPQIKEGDTLNLNYSVDFTITEDMVMKLRALVDIAEDMCIESDIKVEDLRLYSEAVRLMEDLQNISEEQWIESK